MKAPSMMTRFGKLNCSSLPRAAVCVQRLVLGLVFVCLSAVDGLAQVEPAKEPNLTAVAEGKESLREFVNKHAYRQAYGMYVQQQKLGWVIEELQLGKYQDEDVAIYQDESYFSTEFVGEKEVATSTSYVVYSLAGDGPIIFARYVNVEDGRQTTIEGVPVGNELEVTTTVAGEVSIRRVAMPKDTLRESVRFQRWLGGERSQGDRIETWSVDFEEAEIDVPERYEWRRNYELKKNGETLDVVDVELEVLGGEGTLTLTREGRLVQGTLSGFIELIGEDESTVKEMDGALVDLFAVAAVQIEEDLGEPDRVERLVLEVRNAGDFEFPESHRQKVQLGEEGAVTLTLTREHRVEAAEPLSAEDREKYLSATPATVSDHPVIIERAKRVIAKETDARGQAERIVRWVFLNMDAASASNSTNALQILDQRAGDCSEHALLCVALARAAGIPAREVSGVMYGGAGSKFFAWHAWVEVHDGHQWIAVDPTWNQIAVDGTHLKFSHGSRDLAWTNVIGKLHVSVIEVETSEDKKD